ncbi:MAG: hypothetical protein ACLP01_27600 [Solirubrobacteraceae bacterium]
MSSPAQHRGRSGSRIFVALAAVSALAALTGCGAATGAGTGTGPRAATTIPGTSAVTQALPAACSDRAVTISVGLTGCEVVTNGSVQRSAGGIGASPAAGPQLVAQLEHLLAGTGARGSDKGAGSAAALTHGHWSVLARSPLGPRFGATVAWDGQEVLEIGGTATAAMSDGVLDSGAAYDPSRLTWQPIAPDPANLPPANAASVWTGRELFVYGGPTGSHELGAGCCVAELYDPATNRWTISAKAPFGGLDQPTAVWTGRTVILAGLTGSSADARLEVASYDPAGNLWRSLNPPAIAGHEPMAMAIVDTDDGVLLWSLWSRARPTGPGSGEIYSGIDVYRRAAARARRERQPAGLRPLSARKRYAEAGR